MLISRCDKTMDTITPTIPKGRARLSQVLRGAGEVVSVDDVSGILRIEREAAAKLLARWNGQGWMRRLRRGFYAPVPIAALGQEQVLEDPWVIVPELFGPACIGGWSAAEHWGLTEQMFRSTCVLTSRPIREKEQTIEGIPFVLKHVQPQTLFGMRPVWRGSVRIDVTSPAKTIIDMLDDPAIGGGIRHVAECLAAYVGREDASGDELLTIADQLGNRAVFKRLGFLAERLPGQQDLAAACRERLSQGTAKLDPSAPCPRLVTRWRLWVPPSWSQGPA
jgi:predicted transcriptional regulator of viral defense system